MNKESHINQLDGLRFVAIIMVMIAHWLQWQLTNSLVVNIPFVHGVTLFFVLSGFLITRILLKNRDIYIDKNLNKTKLIKNFYLRRTLRIFPIYYGLLLLLYLMNYENTREFFPWLATYSSNIYQSIHNVYIGEFNHFWSLGVEEQFYLFWPFVILFIKPSKTLYTIILTIIIALLTKIYIFYFIGNWMANAYFTIACMQSLGSGALLAYVTLYQPQLTQKLAKPIWLYLAASIYLCALVLEVRFSLGWFKEIADEFLFTIVSFFIILRASTNGFKLIASKILENSFVKYSGKISYGLYVFHLFIPSLFYYLSPKIGLSVSNKYTLFICFYFLTFVVAHLSWKIIEQPLNNLKKYFPYSK